MGKLEMPYGKRDHIKVIKCIAEGLVANRYDGAYLELGVQYGNCFNVIAPMFKKSICVDINSSNRIKLGKNKSFYQMTTDKFFAMKSENEHLKKIQFDLILIGGVFATVGGCLLYFGTKPIVFDKVRGVFWKGRKKPGEVFDRRSLKNFTGLEVVHALQIISEYCRGSKSSYYSYELNLVLKDGKRINVVDHGSIRKLREDAEILSKFLSIPVWDATQ